MASPNDVCVDIKTLLISDAIGVSSNDADWSIHIGREPASPHKVITLYTYGGYEPNPKYLIEDVTFQTRIRSTPNSYLTGQAKGQEIKDGLLGRAATTIGGTKYIGFWVVNDILLLKYDDNNRPIFIINWRITREPANSISETNRTAL